MPVRTESERDATIRRWLELNGINEDWIDRNSITSPNWCDSDTWPEQDPLSSLWEITAQNVAYQGQENPPDDRVIFIPELRVRFSEDAVMHDNGEMIVKFFVATTEIEYLRITYAKKKDFLKRCTSFENHDTGTEYGGSVTQKVWDIYFDFIRDGRPIILFPASYAAQGKLTKLTLQIADDSPYLKSDEQTSAELGYTRMPNIRIYNAP